MSAGSVIAATECVGCGCNDLQACEGGCSWLAADHTARTGVCSNCPKHLTAWRNQRAQVGTRDSKTEPLGFIQIGPTDV